MNKLFQIYHCPENLESTQVLNCHIEEEALLCVMPDPVVCYRDAIFSQKQVGQGRSIGPDSGLTKFLRV